MSGLELLPALALGAQVGGTLLSVSGAVRQGQEADAAAQTQAMQAERQAAVERGQASRDVAARAQEQRRLLSDATAIAAASGGMATDPSVLNLAGEIGGYGYEQRQALLAGGENTARGYDDQAIASRASGKSALRASKVNAFGSLLSGATSAASSYIDLMKPRGLTRLNN